MRQRETGRGEQRSRPRWRGLDYGPAIVVLDTAEVFDAGLPIAWQPLEQGFQIAWCVSDGAGSLDPVEDVLETLADRRTRTQVVAHVALGAVAARLVAEFPETVRNLILVGAGPRPQPTRRPQARGARGGGPERGDPA
ncbi:MAG: hypothetical protein ACT4N7_16355, partial [Actinokineospora sp.]